MTTTNNTFNELITATITRINDEVYCNLIDAGVNPSYAYQVAFIDVPLEDFAGLDPLEQINLSEDFDDVDAFLQ